MSKAELSGIELRKALVAAMGWRFQDYHNGGGFWHMKGCKDQARNSTCQCGGRWSLPALESDPGAFWPEFEKWWKSVEWPGDGFIQGNNYSCGLGSCHWFDIYLRGQRYNYCGNTKATLLEAGCRAWLAALRAREMK